MTDFVEQVASGTDTVLAMMRDRTPPGEAVEKITATGFSHEAMTEAFKRAAQQYISEQGTPAQYLPAIGHLMDLCIAGVVAQAPNFFAASPLLVIEEALYATPTSACGELWALIEARTKAITQPQLNVSTALTSQSKLSLLRFSNGLLRRLSPSSDAELCGRIQLFLSNVLPLSERSALNLGGHFNVDNQTVFDTPPEGEEDTPQWLEYTSFWALHAFMANPLSALKSADSWREFTGCAATTLEVLEAYTGGVGGAPSTTGVDSSAPRASAASSGADKAADQQDGHALVVDSDSDEEQGGNGAEEAFFAPKFLTSFPLFDLQKRDPQVQRQVLVQLLIVLRWLLRDRKSAPPGVDVDAWCVATERRCRKCLLGTGPGSAALVRALRQRLAEEQWWSNWKSQTKCASLVLPPAPDMVKDARAKLEAAQAPPQAQFDLKDDVDAEFDAPARNGTCASIAWASQGLGIDFVAELTDSSRCPRPSLEQHIEAATDAVNPESFFYDAAWEPSELEQDKRWVWRGTRLLAAHAVSLLQRMPKHSFTSTALLAFGKRIPSEVAAEEAAKAKAQAEKEAKAAAKAAAAAEAAEAAAAAAAAAAETAQPDASPAAQEDHSASEEALDVPAEEGGSAPDASPVPSPSPEGDTPLPSGSPQDEQAASAPAPAAAAAAGGGSGEASDSGEEVEQPTAAKRARREEQSAEGPPAAAKASNGGTPVVGPAKPPPPAPPTMQEAVSYSNRGGRIRMGSIAEDGSVEEGEAEGSHPLPRGGGPSQHERRGGDQRQGGGRNNRQGGNNHRGGGDGSRGGGDRPRGRGGRGRNSGQGGGNRKRRRGD